MGLYMICNVTCTSDHVKGKALFLCLFVFLNQIFTVLDIPIISPKLPAAFLSSCYVWEWQQNKESKKGMKEKGSAGDIVWPSGSHPTEIQEILMDFMCQWSPFSYYASWSFLSFPTKGTLTNSYIPLYIYMSVSISLYEYVSLLDHDSLRAVDA